MKAKKKLQLKKKQAQMQTDAIELDGLSEAITYGGLGSSSDPGMDLDMPHMSWGDTGQLDLFSEEDMREKYPALKQAYEHYQSVLEVCKTKEKEEDED